MKKLIYLIVLIVILGLIVPGCLPVVPPTEQSNTGSLTKGNINVNPGESIQDAIDNAGPGDTINVAAGTYTESLSLNNKPVNLIGNDSSTTIIQASIVGGAVITIDGVTNPMTIQGFTIDAFGYDNERGICIQNASGNITVEQNKIINFKENGIVISTSNDNFIKSNTITGSLISSNAGVYVDNESGNNTIDDNEITLVTS